MRVNARVRARGRRTDAEAKLPLRPARPRFPRPNPNPLAALHFPWEFPPRRRRRADAQGTTRGCMRSQNRVQGLSRAKRPSARWCVSPGWEFGPDRNRRLDTGGAAQSATPYGRLKFSPRSRPNCLRKVTSEGRCSMGARALRPRSHSRTGGIPRTGSRRSREAGGPSPEPRARGGRLRAFGPPRAGSPHSQEDGGSRGDGGSGGTRARGGRVSSGDSIGY